jgi:hypothetical protein
VREVRVSNEIANGRSREQETGAPRISMQQVPAFCVSGARRRRLSDPGRQIGGSAVPFVCLVLRFQHSHRFAAGSVANAWSEGPLAPDEED